MAKSIEYCIKSQGLFLQGVEANENYCGTACAATMGALHSFCEYKTIWGTDKKYFEPLTLANYIKIMLEENRWETKNIKRFEVIQK